MLLPHRNIIPAFLLLLYLQTLSAGKRKHVCPIGFSISYKDDEPMCFRRKGPEMFDDKFTDCAGNLYTYKLFQTYIASKSLAEDLVLWTDYKSFYPDGPYVDWSYTDSMGKDIISPRDIETDPRLGLEEELCVVVDPVMNFTSVRCDENHYRYCFVKPHVTDVDEMEKEGCEDLAAFNYWRFWSPTPTCLTAVTPAGKGHVRATWKQAQDLCKKKNGSLLGTGWRYANSPLLSAGLNDSGNFPLGIVLSAENNSLLYAHGNTSIPASDWHFDSNMTTNTTLGALNKDNFWSMVNGTFVFFNVICERVIELKPVLMDLSVNWDGKLVLKTNATLNKNKIYCFTDSKSYPLNRTKVSKDNDYRYYIEAKDDGYYWCVHTDSRNYILSESNKVLYIQNKESLDNYYGIKVQLDMPDINSIPFDDIIEALKDYIYYRTMYIRLNFEDALNRNTTEEIIQKFKEEKIVNESSDDVRRKEKVLHNIKVKRVYSEQKSVLLHVELNRDMLPLLPGPWNDLTVEFMKPLYYCPAMGRANRTPLGSSVSFNCETHSCVGDFNEGVQWLVRAADGCTTTQRVFAVTAPLQVDFPKVSDIMPTAAVWNETTTHSSEHLQDISETTTKRIPPLPTPPPPPTPPDCSSEDSCEETTTTVIETSTYTETVSTVTIPTTTRETVSTVGTFPTTTMQPVPPEEQLQNVMDELEQLLSNDSVPVSVADISPAFDQVDNLLSNDDELQIPGDLLHLLDKIGGRIDLNGSQQGSAVRSNIAILLADSQPAAPVRGLRIAAREEDEFVEDAFEIISEQVNSTHLTTNSTEAVVHLPDSVATSQRRVSFVVFRTDRAFRTNHSRLAVNSRILSINVENTTTFLEDEVIDIHLSPLINTLGRNQNRACAYWHFKPDGNGYWSQEGCSFIRSTEEGTLDTCRCVHLTHFAELLVSRTNFSQRHEDVLEVLSIIGCCVSIFGLAMIGVTAALFRSWRRDYSNKIWLQLCVAIFILIICFLVIVFARFDHYNITCLMIGIILHYSVLASFCWMLVAAILSYRRLVIVFTRDASHKLLRAAAFSWGLPCAIVGILLSVSPQSYAGRFDEKIASASFCYPTGLALWLTVYAPIALMLLANWTLFGLIVRSVFASRRIQRHGDSNEALRCASVSCLLVFLFGLPWIFGLFASNVASAYIFTLTATFQGFVLFLFFVLGNKKTRDLWLNKLKIKQTRKVPVTSSTYTNRSTGDRAPPGVSPIEANSTKPKSLTSSDSSRFS